MIRRLAAAAALGAALAPVSWSGAASAPPIAGQEARGGDPSAPGLALAGGWEDDAPRALPQDLLGTAWEWTGFASGAEAFEIDEPALYRIAFAAPDRLSLRADCNHGGARVVSPGEGRLSIGPVALTRAACADGSLGARLARELPRAVIYSIDGDRLLIEAFADSGSFAFRRAEG